MINLKGKASTSFLQRNLQIGYNRAARIIDMMEENGEVSKANHVGKRSFKMKNFFVYIIYCIFCQQIHSHLQKMS